MGDLKFFGKIQGEFDSLHGGRTKIAGVEIKGIKGTRAQFSR